MKIKIFFIIPGLGGGGAERVFINLVKGINKSIFDVTLIYLSSELNVYEVPDNIRVINLKTARVRNAPFKIIQLVKKEKPNLIISTQTHMNIMLLVLKRFFPKNTKLVVRQSNIISMSGGILPKRLRKLLIKVYKKADKIICQSEYMKSDLLKYTGVHENKVSIIYNPVDIESIISQAEEDSDSKLNGNYKKIFFVGRLTKVKRVSLIINAFEKYHNRNPKSKLFIIGDGPEKEVIFNCIQQKNLLNKVYLLGFQNNPYKYLKYADLFLLASKREGMPNVLIETLVLGIPVLILKHPGGTIDILRNLNIEERFVDNLEIKNEAFNKYTQPILSKINKFFGIENIVKQYEDVFLTVLKYNNGS